MIENTDAAESKPEKSMLCGEPSTPMHVLYCGQRAAEPYWCAYPRQTPLGEERVSRAGKAQMFAKCRSLIIVAEKATPLQFRNKPLRYIVQTLG